MKTQQEIKSMLYLAIKSKHELLEAIILKYGKSSFTVNRVTEELFLLEEVLNWIKCLRDKDVWLRAEEQIRQLLSKDANLSIICLSIRFKNDNDNMGIIEINTTKKQESYE